MTLVKNPNDPSWFRKVMGQWPTGVCVITATPPGSLPTGMAIGSFTSVSLDPPLVAFFPDKKSSTWPKIREAGRFCVNILGSGQEEVCRQFATRGEDKFAGINYRLSEGESPIIEGSVAWIDCEIDSVAEAGDHYMVMGAVKALEIEQEDSPLIFSRGKYGAMKT